MIRCPAFRAYFPAAIALPILVLAFANAAHAQAASKDSAADAFIASTPFSTWLGTAPKPQISWRVQVLPPSLADYQRIHLRIFVKVPGRQVLRHIPAGGLAFMIQVTDSRHEIYQDHTLLAPQSLEKGVTKGDLEIFENMLVVPGQYVIALALYDQKTGEYSFQQIPVTVPEIRNDPLANSWPPYTPVQSFEPNDDGFAIFLAKPQFHLNLSLKNHRPIQLSVILNFTPSPGSARSLDFYHHELRTYLAVLATLTGIDLASGSISAEVVDPIHHRVLFEQLDARDLDWPRLQKALTTEDAQRIDVSTLEQSGNDEAFLAQNLQRQFDLASDPPREGAKPLHVFVVVSNPTDFGMQNAPSQLLMPSGADSLVFYIRTGPPLEPPAAQRPGGFHSVHSTPVRQRPQDGLISDDVAALLAPLKPQTFNAASPEDFRSAVSQLLRVLSQY